MQLNVSPILDDKDNYEGMISVENIINDRKESELKIQAQNKALRDIAWISSHEFRRPVASIVSISSLLSDVKDEEEKQEYISLLRASSEELDVVSRVSPVVLMTLKGHASLTKNLRLFNFNGMRHLNDIRTSISRSPNKN